MGAEGSTELSNEDWTELFQLMRKINRNYPDFESQVEDMDKKAKERGFLVAWNEFKEAIREGD